MNRTVFGEVKWLRLQHGGVSHAVDTGEESETSLCGRAGIGEWTERDVAAFGKCRRCLKAQAEPFMPTEDELSDEARAILAHARRWGQPFTRAELVEVAPGSQWDVWSRYPKTIATLDPIRELVSAGMVVELDEVPLKTNPARTYKRWALAELLDRLTDAATRPGNSEDEREIDAVRTEIIRRFSR